MVRKTPAFGLILTCLLAASCTSIFDSYYPDTVEYLQKQVDLFHDVGGKTILSVKMGYLPATGKHSQDLLVVIAGTKDGNSVLFYDSDLGLVKVYSTRETVESYGFADPPALGLIGEDLNGIYTGALQYTFPTPNSPPLVSTGAYTPPEISISGQNSDLGAYRATYDEAGGPVQVHLFTTMGGSGLGESHGPEWTSAPPAASSFTQQDFPGFKVQSLLDVVFTGGLYHVLFSSGSTPYMVRAADPTNLVAGTPMAVPVTQFENNGGWATGPVAIVRGRADNALLLQAFSWTGSALGSLKLADNHQTLSLAFEPRGDAWYLFDSSTGKLSKNRPWW